MQTYIIASIQEYCKKINSRLSFYDCLSIGITTVFFVGLALFLYIRQESLSVPVSYSVGQNVTRKPLPREESRPFASLNGKTYTFSWCTRSSAIKEHNKVYFSTEEDAKRSGRTLSKLCR